MCTRVVNRLAQWDRRGWLRIEPFQTPEIAELLGFLLGFRNHYMVGQIIYIDGGTDLIMRPDQV